MSCLLGNSAHDDFDPRGGITEEMVHGLSIFIQRPPAHAPEDGQHPGPTLDPTHIENDATGEKLCMTGLTDRLIE